MKFRKPLVLFKALLILCSSALCTPAQAFETFTIKDIRVDGLHRISPGTVFNFLPIHVGDSFNERESEIAIRALFKAGYFKTIYLEREGDVLVVYVTERPAIADITFQGNDDIDSEPLLESLKDIGFSEGNVFNRSLLEKVESELERQYFSRGKYAVKIESTVTPLDRNRVSILLDISEGVVAKIRQINIVGNHVFDDGILLDQLQQATGGLFSFYTKTDQYSKQKLAADLETLRSYYQDRGYINFAVNSTQVSITPDKKDIYITINVQEGDQYSVRSIKLSGKLGMDPELLFPSFQINKGDVFSRKKVTQTVTKISDFLGKEGFAFANVNTIPEVDEEAHELALTFIVDPGKRVYVRRINFAGNSKTRDIVLRQEMRQMEGGWFSSSQVERSRARLQRLGYFGEVNVETPAVPGATDQVDVNYSITEQPSGSISAGVGFSQSSGVILNGSISQENFLGTGKRVSASVNTSDFDKVASFNYTNPYYTVDGVSRGFGAYYRKTDASESNVADYQTDRFGGNVSYGFPTTEFDFFRFTIDAEDLSLQTGVIPSSEITDFIDQHGDHFRSLGVQASWSHDSRNRRIFSTSGGLVSLNIESKLPGSELSFYKISTRLQQFIPLTKLFTFATKVDVGYGDGFGDFDQLPFFENYFAGGVRSIRGYDDNTLGPLDDDGDPLGASFRTVGKAEIVFPPPFFQDSNAVRFSLFYDVGNVFEGVDAFDADELRMSVGVAASWLSPVGPLAISYSFPFNDQSNDDLQLFQFTLGAGF